MEYIRTNLEYREIQRDGDTDYFVETLSYPINLDVNNPCFSRIQFPTSRAILIRTAPTTRIITIHVMKNIDLYSSFANFVIDLNNKMLSIQKQEGYIDIKLE